MRSPDSTPCVLRLSARWEFTGLPILGRAGPVLPLPSTLHPGAEFLEGRDPDSASQVMVGLGSCRHAQERGPRGTCPISPLSLHPTSLHPTPCSGSSAEAGTFQDRWGSQVVTSRRALLRSHLLAWDPLCPGMGVLGMGVPSQSWGWAGPQARAEGGDQPSGPRGPSTWRARLPAAPDSN